MKRPFVILSLILLSVFLGNITKPKDVFAQGRYNCAFKFTDPNDDESEFGRCKVRENNNCNPGYEPNPFFCAGISNWINCNKASGACERIRQEQPAGEESESGGIIGFSALFQELPGFKFGNGRIGDILSAALPYIFVFAGLGLLLYLIFGGIHLMLSQGDQKAMQSARGKITGALIGFLIIFTSYWIIQILGQILGITQITQMFGGGD